MLIIPAAAAALRKPSILPPNASAFAKSILATFVVSVMCHSVARPFSLTGGRPIIAQVGRGARARQSSQVRPAWPDRRMKGSLVRGRGRTCRLVPLMSRPVLGVPAGQQGLNRPHSPRKHARVVLCPGVRDLMTTPKWLRSRLRSAGYFDILPMMHGASRTSRWSQRVSVRQVTRRGRCSSTVSASPSVSAMR